MQNVFKKFYKMTLRTFQLILWEEKVQIGDISTEMYLGWNFGIQANSLYYNDLSRTPDFLIL